MSTRHAVSIFLLFTLLVFPGCIESEHPLSDPNEAVLVPELMGVWGETSNDVCAPWTVSAAGKGFPKGMHRLTEEAGGREVEKYFFVTTIGKDRYINVVNFKNESPPKQWDPSRITHYTLMCLKVEKDQVTLNAFSGKTMEAAKKRGELAFRIVEDQDDEFFESDFGFEFDSETETDTGSEQLASRAKKLREFLATHGDVIRGAEITKVKKH